MGLDKGGSILIHVGINNMEREGTTAIEIEFARGWQLTC